MTDVLGHDLVKPQRRLTLWAAFTQRGKTASFGATYFQRGVQTIPCIA